MTLTEASDWCIGSGSHHHRTCSNLSGLGVYSWRQDSVSSDTGQSRHDKHTQHMALMGYPTSRH